MRRTLIILIVVCTILPGFSCENGNESVECAPGEFLNDNEECISCGILGEPVETTADGGAGCICSGGAEVQENGSCNCPEGEGYEPSTKSCVDLAGEDENPLDYQSQVWGTVGLGSGLNEISYTTADLYIDLRIGCPSESDPDPDVLTRLMMLDVDFSSPEKRSDFGFVDVPDGTYYITGFFDHNMNADASDPEPDEHDPVCGYTNSCACVEIKMADKRNVEDIEFILTAEQE